MEKRFPGLRDTTLVSYRSPIRYLITRSMNYASFICIIHPVFLVPMCQVKNVCKEVNEIYKSGRLRIRAVQRFRLNSLRDQKDNYKLLFLQNLLTI
jgi:hypothetical protein